MVMGSDSYVPSTYPIFRKRVFWAHGASNSIIGNGTTADTAPRNGALQLELATNLGYIGIDVDDDDVVAGIVPLPYDFNPNFPGYFRVLFYVNVAGQAEWILLTKFVNAGAAMTAHGSLSALDTPIVNHTSTVAKSINWTSWGKYSSPSSDVSVAQIDAGACLQFAAEFNNSTTTTAASYLGLEMGYMSNDQPASTE